MNKIAPNAFLIAVLIAFGAFFYAFFNPTADLNDSAEYLQLAHNLAHKNIHYSGNLNNHIDYRLFSKRPALYSLFILYGAVGNQLVAKFIQTILLLLLFFIGLEIINACGKSYKSAYWFYAILFPCTLGVFLSAQFIMADLLLALFIGLIILHFLLYKNSKNVRFLRTIAILWALSIIIKPIMLPSAFVAVALIFPIWHRHKIVLWSMSLPIVLVLAVTGMNYVLTSVPHFSSISAINRVHYNAKLVIAHDYGADSATTYVDKQELNIPKNKTALKHYLTFASTYSSSTLKTHLLTYSKIHLAGIFKSLLEPGRFELYTFFGQETKDLSLTEQLMAGNFNLVLAEMRKGGWIAALYLALLLIAVLKFLGFLLSLFKKDQNVWIMVGIVAYFVGIAGPIGAFRFLMPAIIPFLILSSLGLSRLLIFFQKGSKR